MLKLHRLGELHVLSHTISSITLSISVKLIIIPVTINMYRKEKSDELSYAALFEKDNDYEFS